MNKPKTLPPPCAHSRRQTAPRLSRPRWLGWWLALFLTLFSALENARAIQIVNCDAPVQSRKRGVAANSLSAADFAALAPGLTWYYNWGIGDFTTKPVGTAMEYLPMVYNGGSSLQSALSSYLAAGNRPWRILGLNEPNYLYEGNMTPQQCATAFSQINAIASPYGIPVIAPQMTIGTDPNASVTAYDPIQQATVTYTFQEPFLSAYLYYCGSNAPTAMSTHSYGGYGEVTWITGAMRSDFPNQKVWLTEFNQSYATSDAGVINTMIPVVDYLERTPWIEGYSWFMARVSGDPYNSLLTSVSGGLTPAGQTYVQMPVHYANLYYRLPGRLQAERYVTLGNTDIAPTTDTAGLADMYATAANGSLDYNVQVDTAGTYAVNLRTAGAAGTVAIYKGSTLLGTASVGSTAWSTVSTSIPLAAGAQTLHVVLSASALRLNWLEFVSPTGAPALPADVSAIPGNAQVALSWSPSPGATGYTVQRATVSGGPYTTVGSATTNTFVNTGLTNGTVYYYVVSAVNGSAGSASSAQVGAVPTATAYGVRINSGGAAAGAFSADAAYSGGGTGSGANAVSTGGLVNPAPLAVYQSERYGNFTYTATGLTANASYRVRLHFAELYWTAAGQRVFNVAINGTQVLSNFDIFAAAGGQNKAIIQDFAATASGSGQIAIQYTGVTDNAKSSGIEVLPVGAAVTVANPGFETPATSSYVMNPAGASWTFAGSSGVCANANNYTANNPAAPQGTQVAVLQSTGTISQTLSGLTPGAVYTLRFSAAQRAGWGGAQAIDVRLGATTLAIVNTLGSAYTDYAVTFTAGGTSGSLSFVGKNSGDNTALVDNVRLTSP